MRRLLRGTALFLAMVVGTAVMPASVASDGYQTALYDHSAADQLLRAFDRTHPHCALWSDWHKLCSRTDPKGSTYCRLDREHPALPSHPFCAVDLNDAQDKVSKAELQSSHRFSKAIRQDGCDRCEIANVYQNNRPFSGEVLAQMEHPQCRVWVVEKTWTMGGQQVNTCSEDGRKGMPACRSAVVRKLRQSSPFQCLESTRHPVCGDESKKRINQLPEGTEEVIGFAQSLTGRPVWGYYCD